jgi:hypothetical protein
VTKSDHTPHGEIALERQACPTRTLDELGEGRARTSDSYRPPTNSLRDLPVQVPQTLESMRSKIENEERAAIVLRMRQAAGIAIGLWPCFLLTDWLMATYVHPGSLLSYAVVRLVAWISMILGCLLLRLVSRPSAA